MVLSVLLSACAACATEAPAPIYDLPRVAVYLDEDTPLDVDAVMEGAALWNDLGFDVVAYDPAARMRQCPNRWYELGDVDCELGAYIQAADDLGPAVLGETIRDLRQIWIRSDIQDPTLVVAHELGHLVLDTGEHLEGDDRGVMATSTATAVFEITEADRGLVCNAIGACP